LRALTTADAEQARRQVAFVDATGRVAAHTGTLCIEAAGHLTSDGVSVQANMMRSVGVWPAMLEAYKGATGDLTDRLLAALDAAEAAGGDIRGRQSAAILIVKGVSSGQPWHDRVVDLRVDDAPDPLAELHRLVGVHRGYQHMEAAETHEIAGDLAASLEEYQRARPLLGANDEAAFWSAILMADAGRVEEGKALLADIVTREPGWGELLRRLPSVDLLHNGEATVTALLGS
jgi:uncharacterized Ntn-hydrolase superfamily protein